jgi:hypothetical protein
MSGRRRSHRRLTPHAASSILERDPVVSRLQAYQCVGRNKPSALRHSCLAESPTASDSPAQSRAVPRSLWSNSVSTIEEIRCEQPASVNHECATIRHACTLTECPPRGMVQCASLIAPYELWALTGPRHIVPSRWGGGGSHES